ncbi:hypothetical protein WA026_008562 [Henosepilachna vigintioctopunctata]|uniref:UBX domain-containing protein 1 n=1 Tax=Henosepilachna vigintioctopunctata TaxID=420089 RepID=A0AAW1UIW1_9CUCU
MSSIIDTLIEMGFSKEKAEIAVSRSDSTNIEGIMDWILSHEEELQSSSPNTLEQTEPKQNDTDESNVDNIKSSSPQQSDMQPTEELTARSIKCNDCGKLFKNEDEVQFHAVKLGHQNFSESTEEKKPLTEEEKKEQLAKIEAKLRQRRLDREAREKQEELEREKSRIKSGKELLEAKKKYEEQEMKKILDQRKREKEEERLARQRVKDQIEQDKIARKAKFSGKPEDAEDVKPSVPTVTPRVAINYSEVKLQIRLTDGSSLTQTFQAKEPLSAVRLYIEMNRKDAEGPFNLMTTFPKKVFLGEDYEKPLDTLGLAPSAVLIVSKSSQPAFSS